MPRDTMTVQTAAKLSEIDTVSKTTVVAANGLDFTNDGQSIVMFENYDGSARTVTVVSVADPVTGRSGDLTVTVPAISGAVAGTSFIPPLPQHLFNQSSGKVNINIDAATTVRAYVVNWVKFQQ